MEPRIVSADSTLGKADGVIKAHAVPVPSDSGLAPLYKGTDLLDAFAILAVFALLGRMGRKSQDRLTRAVHMLRDSATCDCTPPDAFVRLRAMRQLDIQRKQI